MKFRTQSKQIIELSLPKPIAEKIRIASAQNRESLSATTTRLLCAGLNESPCVYGLDGSTELDLQAVTDDRVV